MAGPQGPYWEIVQDYEHKLDALLEKGIYKPVFLYHAVLFNILPWAGLVIPRRIQYARPLIFALCLALAADIFSSRRALLGANGYMIGLMTAWWLVWSTTLFVFSDLEHDFQRIERWSVADGQSLGSTECVSLTKVDSNPEDEQDCLLLEKEEYAHDQSNGGAVVRQTSQDPNATAIAASARQIDHFHWQSYPRNPGHRIEWCAGLLFNLRGPEWNWRAPHLGPLPRSVHAQLHPGFGSSRLKASDDTTYTTAKQRLQNAFLTCLKAYILLDILKVLMMRDPYFRGTAPPDSPPPFPFHHFALHPLLTRFYHLAFSCTGVFVALNFVTSFNPLIFLGLSLAFPNASQALTAAPLDAPWLYGDTFGPFLSPILDHGLAGCWGRWWHQLFRHGFTATANWVISHLPEHWASHVQIRRITHVVVAFSLSGFVHACGSYTQLTDTRPLAGPMLFFCMQSVAVMAEYVFKTSILPKLPLHAAPRSLKRAANATFVFCWLFFSGAFIADDFARGGLWLMEPVPVSPLRGLGLANGEGWWCWGRPWFRYWSDGSYWGSGVRVI
ncbi:hypothetical protein N7510_003018 [Penicillium lagena]|uniref:uncharacterized protein n=1 Tax=Penicillium lagena TaxID=94218 RepID=UPI00253F95F8|nr:uncharacterized protein N7510_003018 [Penicillium lagena]KAJ5619034.1 hypothetical protein N7510_003018 [Penicillium lagena]